MTKQEPPTDPLTELDRLFSQAVLYWVDCLSEGIITEDRLLELLRDEAAHYRRELLSIVQAQRRCARR
jgi:hypothetical protein